jgi:lipoate-protein ligase A
MLPCRLIVDPPQEGAWNMAVDEALLDDAAERGTASLRFYQWSEPTLSLGYFQSIAEREGHAPSRGVAAVRRLSGGGALLHDRELTYSLSLPASHPFARQAPALYLRMHQALIGLLAARGVHAALWATIGGAGDPSPVPAEPFLCFARRTAADVVVPAAPAATQTTKIAGSAQRRRRGAILQHGSVLIAASPAAPNLPGMLESTGVAIDLAELTEAWAAAARCELDLDLQPAPLESSLARRADELFHSRYAGELWTDRR